MKVAYLKYFTAYSLPVVVIFSLLMGGWWSYSAVIYLFILIPLFELFFSGDTKNMDLVEEEMAREDTFYDYILYGLVPLQFAILGIFLVRIGAQDLELYEIIGMITACGMACGMAINNAHELGHRKTFHEQLMSKLLLMSSLYIHFFIEHNRGHHKNVATPEDPATSRYGETVYAFYLRSVWGGWMSAWHLEQERLTKENKPFWSWDNEMIRLQLVQLAFVAGIGIAFGPAVLLYFIMAGIIGFLLLETVNYIEHYGLVRQKNGKRYERTLPVHSWNSNHPLGRLILLELSRHSDHHYMADRKYQILRHFDESPMMPTGYTGMMLLSLFPPAWFYVMHRELKRYNSTYSATHQATVMA